MTTSLFILILKSNLHGVTFSVVQEVLAIAGGFNESGLMSQSWSVVMQNGSECSGESQKLLIVVRLSLVQLTSAVVDSTAVEHSACVL